MQVTNRTPPILHVYLSQYRSLANRAAMGELLGRALSVAIALRIETSEGNAWSLLGKLGILSLVCFLWTIEQRGMAYRASYLEDVLQRIAMTEDIEDDHIRWRYAVDSRMSPWRSIRQAEPTIWLLFGVALAMPGIVHEIFDRGLLRMAP